MLRQGHIRTYPVDIWVSGTNHCLLVPLILSPVKWYSAFITLSQSSTMGLGSSRFLTSDDFRTIVKNSPSNRAQSPGALRLHKEQAKHLYIRLVNFPTDYSLQLQFRNKLRKLVLNTKYFALEVLLRSR